jgi:uncharacterized membrane protein YbaN (DUF454 family)
MPNFVYIAIGWFCVGLGVIGLFLPVMPTTVFMILAALAFGRGSPRARAWLVGHPIFGPPILRWEATGAIPLPAKVIAVASMAAGFALACLLGPPGWVLALAGVFILASAVFVLTRPH